MRMMTRVRPWPEQFIMCEISHAPCSFTRMAAAAEAGKQESFMRSMLVFKMGCQQWLEDYGGDTSGYVYKSVKDYCIGAPHD